MGGTIYCITFNRLYSLFFFFASFVPSKDQSTISFWNQHNCFYIFAAAIFYFMNCIIFNLKRDCQQLFLLSCTLSFTIHRFVFVEQLSTLQYGKRQSKCWTTLIWLIFCTKHILFIKMGALWILNWLSSHNALHWPLICCFCFSLLIRQL